MALIIAATNLFKGREAKSLVERRRVLFGGGDSSLLPGGNAQPDQACMAAARTENSPINFRRLPLVQAGLNQDNIPTQLRYSPYFVLIDRVSHPILLLPENPNRCSYVLSGTPDSTALQFSFGYPLPIPGGMFLGMQLAPGDNFQESNGSCSVDNIWVWSNSDDDVGFAFIAYEGVLAIESLQHKQPRGAAGG